MALSTYAELKAAIADLLNRDDLTSQIPDFITLAEADIAPHIDHYKYENRVAGTLDTRYTAFPDDFLSPIRLHYTTSDGTHELRLISQADLADERLRCADTAGRPLFYALTAGEIEVVPTPDDEYPMELVYRQRLDALSDDNTTNWILQNYPALYLYGAAVHASPYLRDDERVGLFAELTKSNIQRLRDEGQQAKFGGAGLRVKIGSY